MRGRDDRGHLPALPIMTKGMPSCTATAVLDGPSYHDELVQEGSNIGPTAVSAGVGDLAISVRPD